MYVCICSGVTDRAVRQAAAEGVRCLADLSMRTGCGACCGSCVPMAEQLLREAGAACDQKAGTAIAA
ncbi:MAG: (2Fe-2S)-binding protein [Xanthomonadales bacterium]|nr:(2Fe-2S)-binding protein [Xanthomonadales bacterium]